MMPQGENMFRMFWQASAFNQNLSSWTGPKARDCEDFASGSSCFDESCELPDYDTCS